MKEAENTNSLRVTLKQFESKTAGKLNIQYHLKKKPGVLMPQSEKHCLGLYEPSFVKEPKA